ncbi:MAG: nuclear transport factor 2 family protein [Ignavibacteriales bacterium]|nr:nuclear transport factor 2 family protein [Ignavibacteriales bacterium]
MNSKSTTLKFNDFINKHDIQALSKLITIDHTFIDRESKVIKSKNEVIDVWTNFFEMYPDYKNHIERVEVKKEYIVLVGYAYWDENSKCDNALWTAKVENGLVAEWRVYYDTKENRRNLGIV